jgi:hypothetical protein
VEAARIAALPGEVQAARPLLEYRRTVAWCCPPTA